VFWFYSCFISHAPNKREIKGRHFLPIWFVSAKFTNVGDVYSEQKRINSAAISYESFGHETQE
jgi:hypothetical protein